MSDSLSARKIRAEIDSVRQISLLSNTRAPHQVSEAAAGVAAEVAHRPPMSLASSASMQISSDSGSANVSAGGSLQSMPMEQQMMQQQMKALAELAQNFLQKQDEISRFQQQQMVQQQLPKTEAILSDAASDHATTGTAAAPLPPYYSLVAPKSVLVQKKAYSGAYESTFSLCLQPGSDASASGADANQESFSEATLSGSAPFIRLSRRRVVLASHNEER